VLQYSFNWKKLSAMAGITWWNFYFQLYPGSIRSPQVVEFLSHLKRQIKRKLLVIWDGSRPHRSRLVKDFVMSQNGAISLEYLPAYAPELNPVEYIWGYWKHHELPNFCPKTFGELSYHAIRALKRMRRRRTLITAFWKQAELF
jgi:transposase